MLDRVHDPAASGAATGWSGDLDADESANRDETAMSLEGVSKCYRVYGRPVDRLKQTLFGNKRRYYSEFWALKNISFNALRGTCLGIVGRNGAGKSTLLQIISQILDPSAGTLRVNGRISAILELGTGFNPEFSGRENVYINGAILGLTPEDIRDRYDDIVAFADIGQFLDHPVKTYSSGMLVRLAFAVAVSVDPDILIIDEALAVGDAKFQAKCFRRFEEFRSAGRTILFVSHAPDQIIRHCDEAILIERGELLNHGAPTEVVHEYLNLVFGPSDSGSAAQSATIKSRDPEQEPRSENHPNLPTESPQVSVADMEGAPQQLLEHRPGYNRGEFRWGDGRAKILDAVISTEGEPVTNHLLASDPCSVMLSVRFFADIARPIFGLTIKTPDGVTVFGNNSREASPESKNELFRSAAAGDLVSVTFHLSPRLCSGPYLVSLGVAEERGEDVIPLDRRYDVLEVFISNVSHAFGVADLGMVVEYGADETVGVPGSRRGVFREIGPTSKVPLKEVSQ